MLEPSAPTELTLQSRVPRTAAGSTLIDYLQRRFPYLDRPAWLREIADGRLRLGSRVLTADARLEAGAQLVYRRAHQEPPVDARFVIVHDDADVVVVDKPAHLPMHADGAFLRQTLLHLLQARLAAPGLQLVHRLDRETSGLCAFARTTAARDALRRQFTAGTVAKAYLAVVRGRATADFVADEPIGHAAASRIALRRSAAPEARDPRPARTKFTLLRRAAGRSLLRCEPSTGRTHQIRVHLEAHGLPVLGDKLYGRPDDDYLAFVARVKAGGSAALGPAGEPGRQLLHAAELAFDHPRTGARLTFASALPAEFLPWLETMEAPA
ncbi:MAG: RluA family pseudouridine synthase [Planctomycetes bacterium]|nr:RluA family pseudouridine synthase [Planctomycetota bacterium]